MRDFTVRWETGKQSGSNALLTDENLAEIGVRREEISAIIPFFGFPGILYTELGVASPNHPCCGSVGINIFTNDNQVASVQDIFYFDQGHLGASYNDTPHWNRERRIINKQGSERRKPSAVDHLLEATDSIKIIFDDGTGKTQEQVINRIL